MNGSRDSRRIGVLAALLMVIPVWPLGHARAVESSCWDSVATDFDGGGPDVVIGMPSFDLPGKPDAGAIVVFSNVAGLGDVSPRTPEARVLLTADDFEGLQSQAGARFGAAVTHWDDTGDFDDPDDCADLLVGAPGQDVAGHQGAGAVYRLGGSPNGLHEVRDQLSEQSLTGVGGAQAGAEFGAVIAGSTLETLAIGVPRRDVRGVKDAGRVVRIDRYGYPTPDPAVVIEQGGLAGASPEPYDRFGEVIELMQTGGGPLMLVGVPHEDIGSRKNAGMVTLLSLTGDASSVHQNSPGAGGHAEAGDRYGASISGSWTYTADDGLVGVVAIGVPGEDLTSIKDAGMVGYARFNGWAATPLAGMARTKTQASPGVPGAPEAGDEFGSALVTGEPGIDIGQLYLVVGTPLEDLSTVRNAGQLTMTPTDGFGRFASTAPRAGAWSQDTVGRPGRAEAGDRFGKGLSLVPLTTSQDDEDEVWPQLLVTIPGEDLKGVVDAGLAQIGVPWNNQVVNLVPPVLQAGAGKRMVPLRMG